MDGLRFHKDGISFEIHNFEFRFNQDGELIARHQDTDQEFTFTKSGKLSLPSAEVLSAPEADNDIARFLDVSDIQESSDVNHDDTTGGTGGTPHDHANPDDPVTQFDVGTLNAGEALVNEDGILTGGEAGGGGIEEVETVEDVPDPSNVTDPYIIRVEEEDDYFLPFGIAIPDSVDYHWPYDDGSGSTATAEVGDVDFDLNGPTWDSDSFGSYAAFDGTDDWALTQSGVGIDSSDYGVAGWFTIASNTDAFFAVAQNETDPSNLSDNGFAYVYDDEGNKEDIQILHRESGNSNGSNTYNFDFDTRYFVAVSGDTDDTLEWTVWDENEEQFSESLTRSRGNGKAELLLGAQSSNYVEMNLYEFYAAESYVPKSDWESIWQDTNDGVA